MPEKNKGIPETEKVKNEEVYSRMNEYKKLLNTFKKKMKKWIGHIMSNNEQITTTILWNKRLREKQAKVDQNIRF